MAYPAEVDARLFSAVEMEEEERVI